MLKFKRRRRRRRRCYSARGTTDFFVSDLSRRSVKANTIKTTDNSNACLYACEPRAGRRRKKHFDPLSLLLVFIYFSVAGVVAVKQHDHR